MVSVTSPTVLHVAAAQRWAHMHWQRRRPSQHESGAHQAFLCSMRLHSTCWSSYKTVAVALWPELTPAAGASRAKRLCFSQEPGFCRRPSTPAPWPLWPLPNPYNARTHMCAHVHAHAHMRANTHTHACACERMHMRSGVNTHAHPPAHSHLCRSHRCDKYHTHSVDETVASPAVQVLPPLFRCAAHGTFRQVPAPS
jgi:hypothetical protein